jgi:ABC-type multidrug transport system ATPase subunit
MKAMFIFAFGDFEETMAGKPSTEAPVANSERWRKRRREEAPGPGTNGEEEAGVMGGKRAGGDLLFAEYATSCVRRHCMKGHIVIRTGNELRAFALDKASPTMIGSAQDMDLRIAEAGMEPMHAQLVWEPRASTWLLLPGSVTATQTLLLNGNPVAAPKELDDGSLVEMPGLLMRFGLTPDTPKLGGQETTIFPLRKRARYVFGRPGGEASAVPKVELDAEDTRLSRHHLEVEQEGPGMVFATDKSQTGTLLNGQRFDRRQLVVGDRLRLGTYCLEFTGSSLRSVPNSGGAKIEARNLTFTLRDGRNILNDVSLDVPACSFVGILGGSGQGKSTLMNALCGVNPATSGEVYVNGAKLGDARQMAAAGIGYVPQDDIVHRELTVTEAITCSARLKLPGGTPARAIADLVRETIDRLGLTEHRDKRIALLSGGQRKRVSIATELLAKPSVLFLDEPSSGLDPKTEYDLMSLLRRLAADCTVVCTTHVLGRAYLFDQLCFVHGGHLIFSGTPDEALQWFQAKDGLEEIYLKVSADGAPSGADWRREFEHARAHTKPLAYLPSADEKKEGRPAKRGPGFFRTLGILRRRQWRILRADVLNLIFLLVQPLGIGVLVGWVADDAVLRMFLCVVATLWFGCSNGAQQIVRELPIFRRERVCGLGLNSYLLSKYLFLSTVTTLQALLLLTVTLLTAHTLHPGKFKAPVFYIEMMKRIAPMPSFSDASGAKSTADTVDFDIVTVENKDQKNNAGVAPALPAAPAVAPPQPGLFVRLMLPAAVFFECGQNILDSTDPGEGKPPMPDTVGKAWRIMTVALGLKLGALVAAACVGVGIGLLISALVRTETQAVMWVPLVLIPQILFGGFVVTRPEMSISVQAAAQIVPSYCAQRMMDTGGIYGQTTPRMTNRTKYPVFLTPTGEQEEVTWKEAGEEITEKYDKVSDWNKSWQNLAVFPELVGRHQNVFRILRGVKKYDETTNMRNDVRYPMGTLFLFTVPAVTSLFILIGWLGACYAGTLFGLSRSQRGQ